MELFVAYGKFYNKQDYYGQTKTNNKINSMKQDDINKLKQFLNVKVMYKEMSEDTADSIVDFCNEYLVEQNLIK